MRLYKITDLNKLTRNNTLWGENVTHYTEYDGKLCTRNCLHAYKTPWHAVIFNPIHLGAKEFILWEAEGNVIDFDNTKVGCNKLTTIRQYPCPVLSDEDRLKIVKKVLWLEDKMPCKMYDSNKFFLARGKSELVEYYNVAVKEYRANSFYSAMALTKTRYSLEDLGYARI